ncbi:ankyrin repeat protein [Colletotrichum chrysophilum]|uniref:Ankyrin repeat protein n=1 Tax=Colletotrichum chrysophilum TaxID=1836956 RepID=A0AAD9AL08_9PEZI|nr:ankyrin repeat protein [Colletotrichum chrysophilum]
MALVVAAQKSHSENALQAAIIGGSTNVVAWVLSQGADVNAEGGYYGTALHTASMHGTKEIVMRLLAEGARADRQDDNGFYPLQIAVRERQHEIANLLLPKSTAFLASIKTSEWRNCFGGGDVNLELCFDPVPAIRKASTEDLRRSLSGT